MIYRGVPAVSAKLAKQLNKLERKPKHVAFGLFLDELGSKLNTPKQRRVRTK